MTSTIRNQVAKEIDRIPAEYLPAVLQVVRAFREDVTFKTAEASFQKGSQEGVDGDTHPVSKLRRTAADVFNEVGPWEGESAQELTDLLREARLKGGSKEPLVF